VGPSIRGKKTGAQNIVKEKYYQKKWLQHVQRMDTNKVKVKQSHYRPGQALRVPGS